MGSGPRTTSSKLATPLLGYLLCLTAGCAGTGSHPAAEPAMTASAEKPRPHPAPPLPPQPESDLEAIEEFLERTREYAVQRQRPVGTVEEDTTLPVKPVSASPSAPASERTGPAAIDQGVPALANAQMALPDRSLTQPNPALPVLESVSIVARKTSEPALEAAPPTRTTNAALDVRPPSKEPSLEDALTHLQTEADSTGDADTYWRLRLVQAALDRRDDLSQGIPTLTDESNELMHAAFEALLAVREFIGDPMATGKQALDAADQLRRSIADRADPTVTSIALCRQVVTFGVYDEMAPTEFVAGRTIHTIVYSEVRNLSAKRNPDGRFETRLATRLELLTTDGASAWQTEEPEIVDTCRRRRTDFFIAQRITLPPTLPAGDYVLKVFVEDKLSERAGEAASPLAIVSPISMAHTP